MEPNNFFILARTWQNEGKLLRFKNPEFHQLLIEHEEPKWKLPINNS